MGDTSSSLTINGNREMGNTSGDLTINKNREMGNTSGDLIINENRNMGSTSGELIINENKKMVKGLISMIQKLESREREYLIDRLMKDLNIILYQLMNLKCGEGCRLNHLLCDATEIVEDAMKLTESDLLQEIMSFIPWLTEVKEYVSHYEDNPVETESVGEENYEDVVGLKEDIQLLLREVIFTSAPHLSTSLISGIAGIGKTTLVRQVYNHATVIGGFDLRVWLRVSNILSTREVLIKLLQQVVGCKEHQGFSLWKKMQCADNNSLRQMLHQHLHGLRFFIVLDDLHEKVRLKSIVDALPYDVKNRLLLISRSSSLDLKDIAYTHRMHFLDSADSWKLFVKTIFCGNKFIRDEDKFPKKLEREGKMVVSKCGGLPFAIKNVGKQIAEGRQSGKEWEQLLESIDFGPTLMLLESYYQRLDKRLKLCFLHLAFFKENTTIRARKLMHIWRTGIIDRSNLIYESYLLEWEREWIIIVKDKSTNDYSVIAKTYCVNSILHMLSIKKAEEELGLEIISNNIANRPSQKPRHRVIKCGRETSKYPTNQNQNINSLFFHGGGYFDTSPLYWNKFQVLKILDLEDFGLKILPEIIGTLDRLKYLGLRNNYLQELPSTLRNLRSLEVLDIALNFMVEVPYFILEMWGVCHIYLSDGVYPNMFLGGTSYENKHLESLTYISINSGEHALSSLRKMIYLNKLGIDELDVNSDVSKLFESLARLRCLDHLILRGFRFRNMPCLDEIFTLKHLTVLKLNGLLPRLPSARNFPPNIKFLNLINSFLDEDPMLILGDLPNLTHLKMRNAYTGGEMVIQCGAFPKLRVLCIEELWNLRNVLVEEGAWPKLEKSEIKNCPYLDIQDQILRIARN